MVGLDVLSMHARVDKQAATRIAGRTPTRALERRWKSGRPRAPPTNSVQFGGCGRRPRAHCGGARGR
eukprot:scaffold211_cov447-Prasinococcus_capsulatus_cf.AAC.2